MFALARGFSCCPRFFSFFFRLQHSQQGSRPGHPSRAAQQQSQQSIQTQLFLSPTQQCGQHSAPKAESEDRVPCGAQARSASAQEGQHLPQGAQRDPGAGQRQKDFPLLWDQEQSRHCITAKHAAGSRPVSVRRPRSAFRRWYPPARACPPPARGWTHAVPLR